MMTYNCCFVKNVMALHAGDGLGSTTDNGGLN